MITSLPNSLKAALNRANLQSLTALFTAIGLGDWVRAMPTTLRGKAPLAAAAYPYIVQAAAGAIVLPDDAKAQLLTGVYARAGTGTPGALTIDAPSATAPAAGHVSISPSGDIQFASADAWTSVDVHYTPNKYDAVEYTLTAASNSATLPTIYAGKTALYSFALEIESTAGTVVKKMQVIAAGGSPSTGQACLNAAKSAVTFASADAVTQCRVKVGAVDVDGVLEAAAPEI